MPLRADATNSEIFQRACYYRQAPSGQPDEAAYGKAARELASAVSEEKDAKYREDTSALTAALREALRVVAEKDAEIARLRDAISDASNILRGGPLAGDAAKSFALRIHDAANLLDATDSAKEAQ